MTLRIITTDERQTEASGVKAVIFGKNGIGKAGALLACSLPSLLLLSAGKQDQGGNNG